MVFKIKSPEQADLILRFLAEQKIAGQTVVFDLSKEISNWHDIPMVLKTCHHCFKREYIGWNINGFGMDRNSVYCSICGNAMQIEACVTIAIQDNKVLINQ
jgi:hypothetical protein